MKVVRFGRATTPKTRNDERVVGIERLSQPPGGKESLRASVSGETAAGGSSRRVAAMAAVSVNSRAQLAVLGVVCLLLCQTALAAVKAGTKRAKSDGEVPKVKVSVFYESYCPDSRNFIVNQLLPTFEGSRRLIDLDLVPYGKATTYPSSNGTYTFTCQHGPNECQGNKVHACVIEKVKDEETQLKDVSCMMGLYNNMDPEGFGRTCANSYNVDWNTIQKCAEGQEGGELLNIDGERTHALSPAATFIPTILLDGSRGDQNSILKDLKGQLCSLYADPKPTECSN